MRKLWECDSDEKMRKIWIGKKRKCDLDGKKIKNVVCTKKSPLPRWCVAGTAAFPIKIRIFLPTEYFILLNKTLMTLSLNMD